MIESPRRFAFRAVPEVTGIVFASVSASALSLVSKDYAMASPLKKLFDAG